MSDARTIDITDSVLSLASALMEGGRGFEVELALSADPDRGAALAAGLVLAGVPLNRIAASALLLRNEAGRDRILDTLGSHDLGRAYNAMMNMGNDRRTPIVVAAMVADRLLVDDPARLEEFMGYACKRCWTDPYTHLSVDADQIRERNPALAASRPRA